jgi:RNA polymerase sigma-70 factor (ECF subfamily)
MPIRVRMEPIIGSELLIATMEVCAVELRDFDKVVEAYWERIYRFVFASLRDQDAAQTVTQDCFLRAYRGRHRYRGDASVHTWLISIAINLVRNAGRNRRFQFWKRVVCLNGDQQDIAHWMPDKAVSVETRLVMEQQLNAVWAASADLPGKQRTVFLLRYVEDMDLLEIAVALGISEGAVKVHLFRAIRSVRKKVGV